MSSAISVSGNNVSGSYFCHYILFSPSLTVLILLRECHLVVCLLFDISSVIGGEQVSPSASRLVCLCLPSLLNSENYYCTSIINYTMLYSTMSEDSVAARNIVEDNDDSTHTVEKKVSFDEEGMEMVKMHPEKVSSYVFTWKFFSFSDQALIGQATD